MASSPATNGGISDAVGNLAPTNSENQREMLLRSAGDSSGVQCSAAGNSSIREEQQNEFAISSVLFASDVANAVGSSTIDWTFAEQNPILSEEDTAYVGSLLAGSSSIAEEHNGLSQTSCVQPDGNENGAADSSTPAFYSWNDDQWVNFASAEGQHPPEDMLTASTASSSAAASGSGTDVDDAILYGASQQAETMDAGGTTRLPMLSQKDGWSLHDQSVQAFRRDFMVDMTVDPRVLLGGADDSADITAEATPADPLASPAQPAEDMGAGSSINNNNSMVAPAATLHGYGPLPTQMSGSSSANDFVAHDATFGGSVQQPQQMGTGNSADFPVATQATPNGFYVQPQMSMVAGNSTTNNFVAQQLSVASPTYNNFHGVQQQVNYGPNGYGQQQMGSNGSVQPFGPQLNTAPHPYGYHGAAQAAPPNGIEPYVQAPLWPNGYDAVSAMACQQRGGLNGGAQPNMGLNVPVVALQVAAPVAATRTRHRQGDASGPAKRRRTDLASARPALTSATATQAPAQQQVAAQQEEEKEKGPYTHTAAGAPNLDSTKKGNRQGQVPYWGQAFRHHNSRCDKLALNGCVPDCQVRAKWPETWADWNSRRFRVEWKTAQNNRPQIEDLSGFAVHFEGKDKSMARFVVLGEIQADGSVGKAKPLHRVEKAAVLGPQSG